MAADRQRVSQLGQRGHQSADQQPTGGSSQRISSRPRSAPACPRSRSARLSAVRSPSSTQQSRISILASSFGVFMFASFTPNQWFGILVAFVLTVALITDATLLPALLAQRDKEPETGGSPPG